MKMLRLYIIATSLILFFSPVIAQSPSPLPNVGKPFGGRVASATLPSANGNVMNDADLLVRQFKAKDVEGILKTLGLYVTPSASNTPKVDEIVKAVKDNKFLSALADDNGIKFDFRIVNKDTLEKGLISFGHQNGAIDVQGIGLGQIFSPTKIADGLGSFVAERFKEELTIKYIKDFRGALTKNNSTNYWSTLLPSTFKILETYDNVFDYKSLMTALKEAAKDDIEKLNENSLLFIEKHNDALKIPSEELYTALLIMDVFYKKAPTSNEPLKLISNIERNVWFKKISVGDVRSTFIVASKILASGKNNVGDFPNENDLKSFLDQDFMYSFIGLVLEKNKTEFSSITIKDQDIYAMLNSVSQASVFQNTLRSSARIQTAIRTYQKDVDKDLLALVAEVGPATKELINGIYNTSQLDITFGYLDASVAIARLVEEEKYGLTIIELIKLLEKTQFDSLNKDAFATIKKYGTFIANIAQATSGQEVKEILEVAAMPVGSYQVKRNSIADISLNAYAGLAGGVEFRQDLSTGAKRENGVFGFTAPLGLAFSWGGMASQKLTGISHTLFFSVIDVGAITSYRLANDTTEALPDFTWRNILAPGVFYWRGLKETPLSIGIGIQNGPQLRGIEASTAVLEEASWMLRLSLSVDIPIFDFYAKTSK